jgi:hypothetical protein
VFIEKYFRCIFHVGVTAIFPLFLSHFSFGRKVRNVREDEIPEKFSFVRLSTEEKKVELDPSS